jgi:hypothetical protein
MTVRTDAKRDLQKFLVKHTGGCTVQNGWPCGTCAIALFEDLGLNPKAKEYKEHNKPVDRTNEVWRAILQIRS